MPTSKSDALLQAITEICDASDSRQSYCDTPAPESPIPLPSPVHPRRLPRVKKRMLMQPKPQHPILTQPTPKVPNEPAPCAPAPRFILQNKLPVPPPTVHSKETILEVEPISCRTTYHTETVEPPVDLRTRAQLHQDLTVTPSQSSQRYFPKALLALWNTLVTALAMPVLDAKICESLEYRQVRHHPK